MLIGHPQIPSLHVLPAGQPCPHLPQFRSSKLVSIRVQLQLDRPARHPQAPLTHICPKGQTFPHLPQFNSSTLVAIQVPLQMVPTGHVGLLGLVAELLVIPNPSNNRVNNITQSIFLISFSHDIRLYMPIQVLIWKNIYYKLEDCIDIKLIPKSSFFCRS